MTTKSSQYISSSPPRKLNKGFDNKRHTLNVTENVKKKSQIFI